MKNKTFEIGDVDWQKTARDR